MIAASRAGMTLVELVVALAVAGAALAAGYGALGAVADRRAAAEETSDATLRAAGVRAALVEWLSAADAADSGRPLMTGLDGVRNGGPDDELRFRTRGRTPADAETTEIRLFVDRDPGTPARGLVVEFTTGRGEPALRQGLADQVEGLEIRYLTGVLGGRRWVPSWISSTVLPAGVEVALLGPDGVPLHPLLALPIRVPLESGR